jgi:UrcA family protein
MHEMKTENYQAGIASPPKVTLLMILCGIVLSSSVGTTAGAVTKDYDVPRVAVRYKGESLATDEGARAVYRRIVTAAENVCPQQSGGPFVSAAIKECRNQAVERAVRAINSPRLAALYATGADRG